MIIAAKNYAKGDIKVFCCCPILLDFFTLFWSSRLEVFCKKDVLKNFPKFAGKHLCQSLFFNKVAGLRPRPATLFKKWLWHRCFPVNFAKFLITPFLQNTAGRLLLRFITFLLFIRCNFIKKYFCPKQQ